MKYKKKVLKLGLAKLNKQTDKIKICLTDITKKSKVKVKAATVTLTEKF